MPIGKVIECTSAKFLNNPKLVSNFTPKAKVREINLSISISQSINT